MNKVSITVIRYKTAQNILGACHKKDICAAYLSNDGFIGVNGATVNATANKNKSGDWDILISSNVLDHTSLRSIITDLFPLLNENIKNA